MSGGFASIQRRLAGNMQAAGAKLEDTNLSQVDLERLRDTAESHARTLNTLVEARRKGHW